MDKYEYCALIVPTERNHVAPEWLAPWYIMIGSALSFGILFLLSHAIHNYLAGGIILRMTIERAEEAMKRDMALIGQIDVSSARSSAVEPSDSNGDCTECPRRSVSRTSIQVIPALPASRSSGGLLAAYLRAYARAVTADPINRIEWDSRLISNLHAAISCTLGFACFFGSASQIDASLLDSSTGEVNESVGFSTSSAFTLFNPFSHQFTPSLLAFNEDPLRDIALMVTCGYLLYDLLLCCSVRFAFRSSSPPRVGVSVAAGVPPPPPPRDRIDDGLTLIHHVLIIFAFTYGVYTHIGTYFMSCFLINELSTPGLNANFFLAAIGDAAKGTIYKLNGAILFMVFFVARVLFNLYVVCLLLLTWYQLRVIFLVDSWPHLFHDEAPLTQAQLANSAILTALAIGHATINLVREGTDTRSTSTRSLIRSMKKTNSLSLSLTCIPLSSLVLSCFFFSQLWFVSLFRAIRRKLCRQNAKQHRKHQ